MVLELAQAVFVKSLVLVGNEVFGADLAAILAGTCRLLLILRSLSRKVTQNMKTIRFISIP